MNPQNILISVIIPSVRVEAVQSIIPSLLNQDFREGQYEILLVTPNKELEAFSAQGVRIIPVDEIYPPGKMRNIGAKKVRGSFLFFIDDDCLPPAEWLSRMLEALRKDERIGSVGCRVISSASNYWDRCADYAVFGAYQYDRFSKRDIGSAAIAVRRKAFKDAGGFEDTLYASEDWDFNFRLKRKGWKTVFDPSIEVRHHHRRGDFRAILRQAYSSGILSGLYVQKTHFDNSSILSRLSVKMNSPFLYVLLIFPYALSVTVLQIIEQRKTSIHLFIPFVFIARCCYHIGVWRRLFDVKIDAIANNYKIPASNIAKAVHNRNPVTVCVINWNQKEVLRNTLGTLIANTHYRPVLYLVFDNGSTDDSVKMVKKEFPNVRIIQSQKNIGYSKAVNHAFSNCDTPLVAQVNSDVLVHENWLKPLVECLDAYPDVALVGGRVLFPNGSTQFCGNLFGPTRMALTDWSFDPGEHYTEVNFHGPFFLARSEAWSHVGGFDEGYSPAYGEDAELGVTLRLAGWRVLFVPRSTVTHLVSRTASLLGRKKMMAIAERHRLRFVLRNYPPSWLALHFSLEWAKVFRAVIKGYLLEYINAWKSLYRQAPEIKKRRREIVRNPNYRRVFHRF